MSYASGDAAEQVVRMSLETGEVAIKLAGEGAKQLAILLYAILRDQKKTKGKARLSSMLRSGKELKVFAVRDCELEQFCRAAKKYGVLYCVLKDRNAKDGITDIMVRAEDASKINRIFERFDLATVDMASVRSEIERSKTAKAEADIPVPERAVQEQDMDALLDELFQPAPNKEEGQTQNPTEGRVAKSRQSEPSSKPKEPAASGISDPSEERQRHSVRKELNEIKENQKKQKAAARGKERPAAQKSAQHKTPPKKKPKKAKER